MKTNQPEGLLLAERRAAKSTQLSCFSTFLGGGFRDQFRRNRRLKEHLVFNNFAQRDIRRAQSSRVLDQRPADAPGGVQLPNPLGKHVDQNVGVANFYQSQST
ncbi:MAG: hypothetical protein WCO56_21050 [Verrucomicrobiota bacterium]